LKHALESVQRNGGKIKGEKVTISCQIPAPVRYEKSFEGVTPVRKEKLALPLTEEGFTYSFEGSGVMISAEFPGKRKSTGDYIAVVEVLVDGILTEVVNFPADFMVRKLDLYWNFDLPYADHIIELKLQNPDKEHVIDLNYVVIYSNLD
jgi:hypothetical protein